MGNSYLIVFIGFIIYCNAQNNNLSSKSLLVEGVLKKIFNLTTNSFSNLPIEEKGKMMNKIEDKLKKSAKYLGSNSSKYVSLIMEGIKSISPEYLRINHYKPSNHIDDIWDTDKYALRDSLAQQEMNMNEMNSQNEFIQNIASNIHLISREALKLAKSSKDREVILNDMKQQIIESAIRTQKKHGTHGVSQLKSSAIAQMVDKLMKENEKKMDARRVEFNFIKSIDVKKDTHNDENVQFRNSKEGMKSDGDDNRIEDIPKGFLRHHIIEPSSNVTFKLPCHHANKIICERIKSLRSITCNDEYNSREISLQKLCDDIKDCADYSDERDCTNQGIQKIRSATRIMTDLENSLLNNCSSANMNGSLLARQNEILQNVLKNQLKFIEKHTTNPNSSYSKVRNFNDETVEIRNAVNEVAVVINTLASALHDTVCHRIDDDDARKFRDIYDPLEVELPFKPLETTTWSPSSCDCYEDTCSGKCSELCQLICTQRYVLDKLQCNSINGISAIPLDLICDGKPDCFDATDENGCSTVTGLAKFEADNMYNLVIELISTKIKSTPYESVRNKFINLQSLVEKLQKISSIRDADVLNVKAVRKECFSEMVNIYDKIKYYAYSMKEMIDMNVFLLSLNEKLVKAMKRSNIGNEKIVAPNKCFCRNSECLLPSCSKICVHACAAETKLERFYCGGSLHRNVSIPIEGICNGSQDCPGGNDEKDCSEDICRRHHFIVLRRNLKEAIKGGIMSVEEALRLWNKRVVATASVMESENRPTRKVIQNAAKHMLEDLVMSYATLRTNRKSNSDDGIDQYYKVAVVIMNFMKSCAK